MAGAIPPADGRLTFERALLYGHGGALVVFDLLLFCFVDLLSSSTLLAAMVVFATGKVGRSRLASPLYTEHKHSQPCCPISQLRVIVFGNVWNSKLSAFITTAGQDPSHSTI